MGKFGSILKRLRESKAISKVKLAKGIGTSDAYVRQIENQGYKPPTFELCEKIAEELSITHNEKLELYEAAFIERIESEKQFYNLLRSNSLVTTQNNSNDFMTYTQIKLRKNIQSNFINIEDKVHEIVMACLSNSKLNYKKINIFERSIELCIANSSEAQIGTELPSIMKMTSSKLKIRLMSLEKPPLYGKTSLKLIAIIVKQQLTHLIQMNLF